MLKSLFTHVKYTKKQAGFIFNFQLTGMVLLTGERLTKMMTENLGYNYTYPVDTPDMFADIKQEIHKLFPQMNAIIPYYSEGWAWIENDEIEKAIICFQLGKENAIKNNLSIENARNAYGLASAFYARSKQMQIQSPFLDDALDEIQEAYYTFGLVTESQDRSPLMMAVTLHTEAMIYQYRSPQSNQRLEDAILKARNALNWLTKYSDDPVQSQNILRRLVKLHFRRRKWLKTVYYLFQYIPIRLKIRKFH